MGSVLSSRIIFNDYCGHCLVYVGWMGLKVKYFLLKLSIFFTNLYYRSIEQKEIFLNYVFVVQQMSQWKSHAVVLSFVIWQFYNFWLWAALYVHVNASWFSLCLEFKLSSFIIATWRIIVNDLYNVSVSPFYFSC